MKNVLIIGASGSLAKYVIDTLGHLSDVHLTLLARSRNRISNDTSHCTVVDADVMDYQKLSDAVKGQDIIYVNLAGDLDTLSKNIIRAMKENDVSRVIAISSIGIFDEPVKAILKPYRALSDNFEKSGLQYTILRPEWFTNADEVDYAITQKGTPETGSAISRKSIAAFVASLVQNPNEHINENLGISKPD
ncbi:NAD(P)H-binding protein [Rhizosphaericola mali]|uniref:NAD(P)H-binding protein n=1 Tax=Rhizosphaericola mali TaxID=2545455 RepID=A0A5P2G5M4_9BACT|nr:NAD(P)H-binding protein [Rhizosphaericola mali]QES88413.1 NAD(P)H-binding protein [Rhizosphaericola mali]